MLPDICKNCLDKGKGRVHLLYLEFEPNLVNETMSEILPFEDNTAGNFCVECDESFQTLLEVTRLLPFRRTFEQAFMKTTSGVPIYYYTKPESEPAMKR